MRKWVIIGGVIGALFGVLWGENEVSIDDKIFFILFWAICGVVIIGINAALSKQIDWNSIGWNNPKKRRMIVKKMISNAIFGAIGGVLIGLVYGSHSLAVFGWAILMAFFCMLGALESDIPD